MSTRCQITVEGQPIYLYKHCDGYPKGVLPTLVPFVKKFMDGRGWDPEYMMARMTGAFLHADSIEYEEHDFTGFGLDTELHGDIEYLYTIRENRTVKVYKVWDAIDRIIDIDKWDGKCE